MTKWDGLEKLGVSKLELIRMVQEAICMHDRERPSSEEEWCADIDCDNCIYSQRNTEDFIKWVGEDAEGI